MPCSPGRRLDDVDHEDRGPLRPGVGLPPATQGVFYMQIGYNASYNVVPLVCNRGVQMAF